MKNISQTMDKADASKDQVKDEADISIVERIVRKTGNRKLAAILALDLFLVGVDTVSIGVRLHALKKIAHGYYQLHNPLRICFGGPFSRQDRTYMYKAMQRTSVLKVASSY